MTPVDDAMASVEPVLSRVRERLRAGGSDARSAAQEPLEACSAYLGLFCPPQYASFSPSALVRSRKVEIESDTRSFVVEAVHDCIGDVRQIWDCLRIVTRAAALGEDTSLVVEVCEEASAPIVALSFDGPGSFPSPLGVTDWLDMPLELLGARWTAATRGGRIDPIANGFVLRLTGQRMPPESYDAFVPAREAVQAACEQSDLHACLAAVDAALAAMDGSGQTLQPGELATLISGVVKEYEPQLTAASIVCEPMLSGDIPPVLMVRDRLRAFFANAMRYTLRTLRSGGVLALMAEYDARKRAVEIVVTIDGKETLAVDECLPASMRRAMVDGHRGGFEISLEARSVTISAILPDPVGCELDTWMPGFDVFTERSRQVLRLLRSGGEGLPEVPLLAAVLEEELEAWLLPRLAEPAMSNIAHESAYDNRGLPGSSPERLKKALDQIKRGKPRKEIARPPYAAELLFAFRRTERERAALGAVNLSEDEMATFAQQLLANPPAPEACLRLIARARRA